VFEKQVKQYAEADGSADKAKSRSA
jgi:hypothetical protein